MLKKLVIGVSAAVLAGGVFMTAEALSSPQDQLPGINAPLTVRPVSAGRTASPSRSTPTSPGATTPAGCAGDESTGEDRHGREHSSDASDRDCDKHGLMTVMPPPSVLTSNDTPGFDDHGDDNAGNDNSGNGNGETEPGDDNAGNHNSGDGNGETEPGDDNSGNDNGGKGNGGGDDSGGIGDSGSDGKG